MRLFIALSLPPDSLEPIARLQAHLPLGRLVPEDNLHLTLAFLGDRADHEAEAVHDALQGLKASAVTLTLAGPALYGNRRSRALGLEAQGGPELTALHARVTARLHGAGVAQERRRFRPHVTLARLSGSAEATRALAVLTGARLGPFACDEMALMVSTRTPSGALYEALAVYPLSGFPSPRPGATPSP